MKYIIFKRNTMLCPVIIPEHVTHSQVKLEGCSIHSAKFFYIGSEESGDIVTVLPDSSDSLGIGPKDSDKELLVAALGGFGVYAFMEGFEALSTMKYHKKK